jgi:4-phospho-D-threonate 3-dehydrogenase / 4-phospho-D-erythronate 3-dehydrogenase
MPDKYVPRIVVTLGDPAGIGCEVILKALSDPEIASLASWTVIGDATALATWEALTGVRLNGAVKLHGVSPLDVPLQPGELRAEYGHAATEYVRLATEMCLAGTADAMVTAPLNKEAVSLSGMRFSGHTEYIAELCGVAGSRMLLAAQCLSVVHVSTHISLRDACNLRGEDIIHTIRLGHDAMALLGKPFPRIAVCGLNPHAGENGLFGIEDLATIAPAIGVCRRDGIQVDGPHAPDTIFLRASQGSYDLIVAMYHDQGHIPMKLLAFDNTVNISLGIPILRTSVDHGTAFDIAGKNLANPANMKSAMKLAVTMAETRRQGVGSV